MVKLRQCDLCGQPAEIMAKLFMTDLEPRARGNSVHANYQRHADVGKCCHPRVVKAFKWQARMTREEYAESRRQG